MTDIADHPMPVDEALALVALTQRRDHFPSQLSGGQQQRVAMPLEVAGRNATVARVRTGLTPDQRVVVYPAGAVADGRAVKVRAP